jgi:hypothetical protein
MKHLESLQWLSGNSCINQPLWPGNACLFFSYPTLLKRERIEFKKRLNVIYNSNEKKGSVSMANIIKRGTGT